jgi:hypothetical protein
MPHVDLARLSKLARTQKGQIAAIEMGSQEIFIGKDVVEATTKGWKKYPGQSFYFVRIGYPAVHRRREGCASDEDSNYWKNRGSRCTGRREEIVQQVVLAKIHKAASAVAAAWADGRRPGLGQPTLCEDKP